MTDLPDQMSEDFQNRNYRMPNFLSKARATTVRTPITATANCHFCILLVGEFGFGIGVGFVIGLLIALLLSLLIPDSNTPD